MAIRCKRTCRGWPCGGALATTTVLLAWHDPQEPPVLALPNNLEVTCSRNLNHSLDLVSQRRFDVISLYSRQERQDLQALHGSAPLVPLILISDEDYHDLIALGADDCIRTDSPPAELARVIRLAAQRRATPNGWVNSALAEVISGQFQSLSHRLDQGNEKLEAMHLKLAETAQVAAETHRVAHQLRGDLQAHQEWHKQNEGLLQALQPVSRWSKRNQPWSYFLWAAILGLGLLVLPSISWEEVWSTARQIAG